MSHQISPESPRRIAARAYGLNLRRIMAQDGLTQRGIATKVGIVDHGRVHLWVTGKNLPSLDMAQRLAETLNRPELLSMCVAARTIHCRYCKREFVSRGGVRLFCSDQCKRLDTNRRKSGSDSRSRGIVAERQLEVYHFAVESYCHGCEPEGMCRDSRCDLRPVSPLPLDVRRDLGATA